MSERAITVSLNGHTVHGLVVKNFRVALTKPAKIEWQRGDRGGYEAHGSFWVNPRDARALWAALDNLHPSRYWRRRYEWRRRMRNRRERR